MPTNVGLRKLKFKVAQSLISRRSNWTAVFSGPVYAYSGSDSTLERTKRKNWNLLLNVMMTRLRGLWVPIAQTRPLAILFGEVFLQLV